jgi:hypothetical protein
MSFGSESFTFSNATYYLRIKTKINLHVLCMSMKVGLSH